MSGKVTGSQNEQHGVRTQEYTIMLTSQQVNAKSGQIKEDMLCEILCEIVSLIPFKSFINFLCFFLLL